MGFLWTHYSDARTLDAREAQVEYDGGPQLPRTVRLPSGITPRARLDIADKLGLSPDGLVFTNAPGDTVVFRGGNPTPLSFPAKVRRAKELVTTYLTDVVAPTGTSVAGLVDLIAEQPVGLLSKTELSFFMRAQRVIGSGNTDTTEGATSPHPRGAREVAINRDFHTLYAVVHELFHAVEADDVAALGPGLFEGLTEYLTVAASGLDARRDPTGEGHTYQSNLDGVRAALASFVPLVTEPDLFTAYFAGDFTAIKQSFESKFYTLLTG